MDSLKIFDRMAQDNNIELQLAGMENIKSIQTGKDGWGSITIAVPNGVIVNLASNENYYVGGLLIAKREEYEKFR